MRLLPWLLDPPGDFTERCKRLDKSPDIVADLRTLAHSELSVNQSHRLHRLVQKSEGIQARLRDRLTSFTLGLVSNGTVDLLIPTLVISALRHGIALDVLTTDFDQALSEAVDPESNLNKARPDAILIALDFRAFPFGNDVWAKCPEGSGAKTDIGLLQQIREGFRANCGAVCIVQTLATPPHDLAGSLDRQIDGLLRKEIAEFNRALVEAVSDDADVILDIAGIVEQVGSRNWFDDRQWFMARIPMANEYIPLYCDHIARLIAASRGKTHKCLVLDLDNTLWGGVIGDDGIDGIVIGQGNPAGEAYLALQKYAKELKSLGIILAVCSKNDDSVAREVFRKHPDMLLSENDFAIFVANWEDKASNLRQIAQSLNIGLDALVFVDDNPAERDIVRTFLPQVAVPELPTDPAMVPRTVAAAGYFEMVHFNNEDALRGEQYAANASREKARTTAGDLSDFLQSLEMKMSISPFDSIGRKRITQLINKTNQFNLTTRRRTETEIEALEQSNEFFTLQARLADRFGDNGMISVVICRKKQSVWEIDTWLMSCRVIKRRAEEAICDELVRQAKAAGVSTLKGVYDPTDRNALVRDHYQKLGFTSDLNATPAETWTMEVADYIYKQPPIEVCARFRESSAET